MSEEEEKLKKNIEKTKEFLNEFTEYTSKWSEFVMKQEYGYVDLSDNLCNIKSHLKKTLNGLRDELCQLRGE